MRLPSHPRSNQRGGAIVRLIGLVFLIVFLLILYLARAPLLRAVAAAWIADDPLEKAQAIVVLGGDSRAGDRLRHAVQLYRAGWAPRIVLSGAAFRTYFNESELMAHEAKRLGVPPEHLIIASGTADSTLEEALGLRAVLAKHDFRKVIVVTSNFHTRRTRTIFRSVYRPLGTRVIVSAAPDRRFDPQAWWQQREGLKQMVTELAKLLYTWWELLWLPSPREAPDAPSQGRQPAPAGFGSLRQFSLFSPQTFSTKGLPLDTDWSIVRASVG
ncbi:MAG TPA: YdcF family protein, partial [Candidatus Acidoferrales bacterium]|nr:YdcF family protein [Candidatus Acidoferrales bacterium]